MLHKIQLNMNFASELSVICEDCEFKMENNLLNLKDAAQWASEYLDKAISISNISYLVQYGKIRKFKDDDNSVLIDKNELKTYYDYKKKNEELWKQKLGDDLNWNLSFDQFSEAETTKHVHRLHPYKGKFIPQLVEYFLDTHTDKFKKKVYFNQGDIVLDPFMGSGTTLIQASELGIHSIGIDISEFNCLIAKAKFTDENIVEVKHFLTNTMSKTIKFSSENFDDNYDIELKSRISGYNKKYFPSPEFKRKIRGNREEEERYGQEKLYKFLEENDYFFRKNGTKDNPHLIDENEISSFLSKWFNKRIQQELAFYIHLIKQAPNEDIRTLMKIVLSRTARSCRATTHFDLATLKKRQIGPYYCYKHKKLCTPINSIIGHLRKNTYDTINRIVEFSKLKKDVSTSILHGDSRNIDIFSEIELTNPNFFEFIRDRYIDGLFTSPPYVGQIDYHEQHAYAYELFDIPRRDNDEIGPLTKGQGKIAQKEYVDGISQVLINVNRFIKDDGNYFIVANDKFNLYPIIAEKSNLEIVNEYKRPVLNRTERDRQPYAEIIFHMVKN